MALGERLYELRKNKNYSQEDVARKLNVTRQTISKWETNQSSPDFDKIIPLCDLYEISTDELLRGIKTKTEQKSLFYEERKRQRQEIAKGICLSLLLYFIAVIWLIVVGSMDMMLPGIMLGIFLLICAMATINLVYRLMTFMRVRTDGDMEKDRKYIKIDIIISTACLAVYLLISMITMKWRITWIIWIVDLLVIEIVHLILDIKEQNNEES